jgi:hypothetical protein
MNAIAGRKLEYERSVEKVTQGNFHHGESHQTDGNFTGDLGS